MTSTELVGIDSPTIGRSDAMRVAVGAGVAAASGFVVLMVAARVLVPVADNTVFVTYWSTIFACFGVLNGVSIETTRAATASMARLPDEEPRSVGRRPRLVVVGAVIGLVAGGIIGSTVPLWAPHLFSTHSTALGSLVAVGVAGFSMHSVVVGTLAGTRRWKPYSLLIGTESAARLLVIVGVAMLGGRLVGFATGAALAVFTWAVFLVFSPSVRAACAARADSSSPVFARRLASAAVATGASALLVVGFPTLMSLSTPSAEWTAAAPLVLAITLTRAPLMIPLNAYQGVAVSHFVKNGHLGLRALLPICRAVVLVGIIGAGAAFLAGPWIMRSVLGPEYEVSRAVLAALVLAAIILALISLTGALCQALTLHRPFVAGWMVALLAAIGILQVPGSLELRAIAALALGPALGMVVHLLALRGRAVPRPSEHEAFDPPATSPGEETMPKSPGPADGDPDVRVSVCMATYNGAEFVREQLQSIFAQLAPNDEVVVVDDASTDQTRAEVREFGDPRLRLIETAHNSGYVRTFERAIQLARGRIIVLADQDDVWVEGRLDVMVAALDKVEVVATNLQTLGGPGTIHGPYGQSDWSLRERDSGRYAANIVGILGGNRPYFGCAMAMRREVLRTVLPIPDFLTESHDLWIAMYGNMARSIAHVEFRTVSRRYHASNASPDRPRGILSVVRSRLLLLTALRELRRRRGLQRA